MGVQHTEILVPGVAVYIGLAAETNIALVVSAGALALHTQGIRDYATKVC